MRKTSYAVLIEKLQEAQKNGYLKNMSKTGIKAWEEKIARVVNKMKKSSNNAYARAVTKLFRRRYHIYKSTDVFNRNYNLNSYKLESLQPKMRAVYRARTASALSLIKTQNDENLLKLKNRFYSWLTTAQLKDPVKISEAIKLPSNKRIKFILHDQSNKLRGALDDLIAKEYGAIAFQWKTRKDNRVAGKPTGLYPDVNPESVYHGNHWNRQDKFYYYSEAPKNVLKQLNLEAFAGSDKSLKDGMPGYPIGCRCYAKNFYLIEDLPEALWSDSFKEKQGVTVKDKKKGAA